MKTFWDSGCPTELIEASRLEGASEWQIFWRIGMPVLQTGLVTVALLSFVGAWNNFFFPLIVLSQESLYPLTLGLNVWNSVIDFAEAEFPDHSVFVHPAFEPGSSDIYWSVYLGMCCNFVVEPKVG